MPEKEPERTLMILHVENDGYKQSIFLTCPDNCGCPRFKDHLEPAGMRVCPLSVHDYLDIAVTGVEGIPVYVAVRGFSYDTQDGREYDTEVTILPTGRD